MNNQYIKRKIKAIIAANAKYVKRDFGIVVNEQSEFKRIYAEFQAGIIPVEEIDAGYGIVQQGDM